VSISLPFSTLFLSLSLSLSLSHSHTQSEIMSIQASLHLLLFAAALINLAMPTSPKEKLTHLHFYFHEVDSGPSATVVASVTLHRSSTFGDINLFDNTLRVGPEPDSALLGGAQV
jgi:Dirigent-like protein